MRQKKSIGRSDRAMPFDVFSEHSLLGAILLAPDSLDELDGVFLPEFFYLKSNEQIFRAAAALHTAGKGVDPVTLAEELQKRDQLNDVGGYEYLHQLLATVPHSAHARFYAEIVRAKWMWRQLIFVSTEALVTAYGENGDVQDAIEATVLNLNRILEQLGEKSATHIGPIVTDALARVTADEQTVASTGNADLDGLLKGWKAGDLTVVAARTSVGKSALAFGWALQAARAGVPTVIFSLEQGKHDVALRLLSGDSGVPFSSIDKRFMTEEMCDQLAMHSSSIAELPLYIDDSKNRTVDSIGASVRILKRKFGVKLVVVDYLQFVRPADSRQTREQQVAATSRDLKTMAGQLGVSVIVLAQLNRDIVSRHDKIPRLSDIRESGAIEQDADVVALIHRPWMDDNTRSESEAVLLIQKNRNGPTGRVHLHWTPETMTYRPGINPARAGDYF